MKPFTQRTIFIPTGSDTKFASKEIPDEIKKLWDLE